MPNYSDKADNRGGSKSFRSYLQKARLSNSILPHTKFYMQRKAGSATNKLMRSKTLADYGLNISGDGKDFESYKKKYFNY